jgi:hypothetical protein
MKKTISLVMVLFLAIVTFAQSDKYAAAMKTNISQLDSVMSRKNGVELANNFARIGDAEKTQWLPYYYAAYSTIAQALSEQDNSKKDPLADKATEYITKAETILGKDNSETDVIKSMIATAHMTVDPQSRYMNYVPVISENIAKAKSLDPSNPRPWLLEAENKYFTPEQFGGGKDAAKELFDKCKQLMDTFKPETDLSPNWGKESLAYFLSQYK